MSDPNPSPTASADFSLFAQEEAVIEQAEEIIGKLEDVGEGVRALARAYRQSYRETQRLVRLSDRMQDELRRLNAKLETEVAAREDLAGRLAELAATDDLTGALTRRRLTELIEHERRRCGREGKPLSLTMVDIDHFKRINDRFGHAAGDFALKEFVARLRHELRDSDAIGRMGGEEFAILLPESGLRQSEAVAERLRVAVSARPIHWMEHTFTLTATFGVAEMSGPDDTIDSVLSRADKALYAGKRAGRDRITAIPA